MNFQIHDAVAAPEGARDTLDEVRNAFGFIPNLIGVMSASPSLLKAYRALHRLFDETSFSPTERQIVLITANYENDCTYCVAAHTVMARMQRVPEDVVSALREGTELPDQRQQALREFTRAVVATRGWPSAEQMDDFEAAGYTQAHALEVILGVGFKILSNYTNHLAKTPLDEAFATAVWSKPEFEAVEPKSRSYLAR